MKDENLYRPYSTESSLSGCPCGKHGSQDELYKECGYDAVGIAQAVRDMQDKVKAAATSKLLR